MIDRTRHAGQQIHVGKFLSLATSVLGRITGAPLIEISRRPPVKKRRQEHLLMNANDEKILHRVILRSEHKPSGKTKHTVHGIVVEPPYELRILQFKFDAGYYLVHIDKSGNELADTCHESLKKAMEQANFEFGIKEKDWT